MNDLPFRLKIASFYFFLQGAVGMVLSIALWFLPKWTIIMKIFIFILIVLLCVLNIEVGKGLKKLKKWSFIAAIIMSFLQPLSTILAQSKILLLNIFGLIVFILLLTISKLFWHSEDKTYKQDIVT